MKNQIAALAIASGFVFSASHATAQLPGLSEKPWLGYFLGLKDRKFQFGIITDGDALFEPLKRDGSAVSIHNPVKIHFEVLETMPDGKVVSKTIRKDTLASQSPAIEDPSKPVTFTGKVTGDAAFEVTVIPERGAVTFTGKITDKGTLSNPLSFAITSDFSPYKNASADDAEKDSFEKKIKRDEIRLEMVSGDREKLEFIEKTNPAETFKEGFTSADIRTEGYGGVGFEFEAVGKSKIIFEDKGEKALWDTFSLRWISTEPSDKLTIKGT